MDLNPYQPPLVAVPTLADEQSAGERPAPRPLGIWLLAGLHLLAGMLFLVVTAFVLWQLSTGGEFPSAFPFWFVAIICGFMATLALGSALGMWLGKRWGWWLTAFYYVWAILGDLAGYLYAVANVERDEIGQIGIRPEKLILLAIHVLILGYLFKGTVRAFFRLESLSTIKALTLLALIAIVVLSATYGVANFQQTDEP